MVTKMNIEEKIGRGIPKKIWLGMIENDMCVGDMENREKWRFRTKVVDHK